MICLLAKNAKFHIFVDVTIGIKISFLKVLVTIETCCSLLQFVTMNCLIFQNSMITSTGSYILRP